MFVSQFFLGWKIIVDFRRVSNEVRVKNGEIEFFRFEIMKLQVFMIDEALAKKLFFGES